MFLYKQTYFYIFMSHKLHQFIDMLTFVTPNYPTHLQTMDRWRNTNYLPSNGKTKYHYFFMIVAWHNQIDIDRKKMDLLYHYFNVYMQYTLYCDEYGYKMTIFNWQALTFFLSLLKHRLWALIATASLSTHILCSKTEKNSSNIPVTSSFTIWKRCLGVLYVQCNAL